MPGYFVTAYQEPARAHIDMQAVLQRYVDNAISKTINIPEEMSFAEFNALYDQAYEAGLKGCTTFRLGAIKDEVLEPGMSMSHCCTVDREAD